MAQRHTIPNMSVKRYRDDNTYGVAPREDSSMPKFINNYFLINLLIYFLLSHLEFS